MVGCFDKRKSFLFKDLAIIINYDSYELGSCDTCTIKFHGQTYGSNQHAATDQILNALKTTD